MPESPFRRVPPGGSMRAKELARLQAVIAGATNPTGRGLVASPFGTHHVPSPPPYIWARLTGWHPDNGGAAEGFVPCPHYTFEELEFNHCRGEWRQGVGMVGYPKPEGPMGQLIGAKWPAYEVNDCYVPDGAVVQLWRGNGNYFLFHMPNLCGEESGASGAESGESGSGESGGSGLGFEGSGDIYDRPRVQACCPNPTPARLNLLLEYRSHHPNYPDCDASGAISFPLDYAGIFAAPTHNCGADTVPHHNWRWEGDQKIAVCIPRTTFAPFESERGLTSIRTAQAYCTNGNNGEVIFGICVYCDLGRLVFISGQVDCDLIDLQGGNLNCQQPFTFPQVPPPILGRCTTDKQCPPGSPFACVDFFFCARLHLTE